MPKADAEPRLVVPKGHRPEEFLRDDQLAEFYRQEYESLPDDHPKKGQAKIAAARATVAAAMTSAAVAEHEATSAAEIRDQE